MIAQHNFKLLHVEYDLYFFEVVSATPSKIPSLSNFFSVLTFYFLRDGDLPSNKLYNRASAF